MEIKSLADILSIVNIVILGLAVLVGAIWRFGIYRRQRIGIPKANLLQEVQAIKLHDTICIHIAAKIRNTGDVMISIRSATNIVQQIRPLHDSTQKESRSEAESYDKLGKEINWPGYSKEVKWEKGQEIEIEPGEEDTLHFDLLIPAGTELIQVYTYFQNVAKKGRDIGWHTQRFYDITKLL